MAIYTDNGEGSAGEEERENGKDEVMDNLDENGLKEEEKNREHGMKEVMDNLDENGLKEDGKAMEETAKNLDENGLKDETEDEHMAKQENGKKEEEKKVEENGDKEGGSWANIAAPSSEDMVNKGDIVDISTDVPLGDVTGEKPEYENENEEKKEGEESWAHIASEEVHEGEKLDNGSKTSPTTTTSTSTAASSSKPHIAPYQAKPKASSSHKPPVKVPESSSPESKHPAKPKDPATEELKHIKLRGKDIGANIGDLSHQLASAPNPETAELKATKIGPHDIGTNIGDPLHQLLAHEEAEHKRLQAVKTAQKASLASMDVDIASFAAEGTSAEFKAGGVKKGKERRMTTGNSKRPHMEEDDEHDGSEMQKPKVARHQGEDIIVSTKVEKLKDEVHMLQSEIGGLKKRLAELETPKTAENGVEKNGTDNMTKKIVRSTKFVDGNDTGELDRIMKWGMWGGMIVAIATIGGWMGAAVERGAVGRGVAEWVWKQTAKSV
ncbi:hypothetical protein BZA77DRAFT_310355 [Pyronema omphalodes]|nr:hypothetical protein BZA77DRAFT_310355 [Pyronema omphalodes]